MIVVDRYLFRIKKSGFGTFALLSSDLQYILFTIYRLVLVVFPVVWPGLGPSIGHVVFTFNHFLQVNIVIDYSSMERSEMMHAYHKANDNQKSNIISGQEYHRRKSTSRYSTAGAF